MKELEKVLNKLKEGKSRDPNGWVRDLFKNEVAGTQLKISLLMLMNKMKSEKYIPDFIRNADVTTIYKGKGDKFNLENDRGIFLVTTFRSRKKVRQNYSKIDKLSETWQVILQI